MPSKKKTTTKKRKSRPPPGALGRLQDLGATRLGRVLLVGLGTALLLLAAGLVVRQARAHAYALAPYRLGPRSVRFVGLDPRLGPLVAQALTDPAHFPLDVSVFDPDAEAQVREVVSRHPMVAAVRRVAVRFPDRVDVEVTLRRPAAWFQVRTEKGGRGYVLVSEDACLLDHRLYRPMLEKPTVPLPRVVGVRAPRPPHVGQTWDDLAEQVAEGLSAARLARRLYQDFRSRVQVDVIDVSAFPAPPHRRRDGELRLHLADGNVVEWGRTERALDEVAGEDLYATKRWRLETQLTRRSPNRTGRIDVRFRLPREGQTLAAVR